MSSYSIKDILKTITGNIVTIILCGIIFGGLFGMYAHHKKSTTYTSSRSIFVTHDFNRANNKKSQVEADQSLVPTYRDILEDQIVMKNARERLPHKIRKQYSVNDISQAISTSAKPDSLVIVVHAKTKKAVDSTEIVNAVTNAFKYELPKVNGEAGNVHLLSKANEKDARSVTRPSTKKYIVVGIAFGLLLGMILSFSITTLRKIL